jgi:hypothetical protein
VHAQLLHGPACESKDTVTVAVNHVGGHHHHSPGTQHERHRANPPGALAAGTRDREGSTQAHHASAPGLPSKDSQLPGQGTRSANGSIPSGKNVAKKHCWGHSSCVGGATPPTHAWGGPERAENTGPTEGSGIDIPLLPRDLAP